MRITIGSQQNAALIVHVPAAPGRDPQASLVRQMRPAAARAQDGCAADKPQPSASELKHEADCCVDGRCLRVRPVDRTICTWWVA